VKLGFQEFVLQENTHLKIGFHAYATKLGFAHVDEKIDNFLNIDNFPMINARKESSIDQLRPPLQTYFFQAPIPHHQLLQQL
jgi:hypothetical protein